MKRTREGKKKCSPSLTANLAGKEDQILAILADNQPDDTREPSLMLVDQEQLDAIGAEGIIIESDVEGSLAGDESQETPLNNVVVSESELPNEGRPAKLRRLDKRGRGRSLDPVWNLFQANNKLPSTQMECKACGAPVSNKVLRLKNHLERHCKTKPSMPVSRPKSVPETPTADEEITGESKLLKTGPVKYEQSKMTNFIDKLSKREERELKDEIGKYMFSTNLPFSHVENPAFVRFIKKLRPACTLPSRWSIGNTILNRIFAEVKAKRDHELEGKTVTILQDGWKTRTSEPIIAHSITTGEKSYFFNAIDAEENTKTAKYCANLLKRTIADVKSLGANVIAVVTDNCKSMEKMRKIIGKEYPEMFTYGCHPHLLNLIGKKFTPDDLTGKIQSVHSFFRCHDAAWSLLKKKKCGRPLLPSETRWNAWIECFEYYLDHHATLLEVSRNPISQVNENVQDILNDGVFYRALTETTEYLKPIKDALNKLQRENATLADGVDAWIHLKNKLAPREIELEECFDIQFGRALQPVGIAAHMLHPNYRGAGLPPALIKIGNNFLAERNPTYVVLAAMLKQKDEKFFPANMFTDELLRKYSADIWWRTLECLEMVEASTVKFVSNLMCLPAGSADIERHFSVLGNIMHCRRARLGIDKAAKLCVIYKYFAGNTAPGDDGCDWDISQDS